MGIEGKERSDENTKLEVSEKQKDKADVESYRTSLAFAPSLRTKRNPLGMPLRMSGKRRRSMLTML